MTDELEIEIDHAYSDWLHSLDSGVGLTPHASFTAGYEAVQPQWVSVDMSDADNIPAPLCNQSGGWFYVIMDGGIHGVKSVPSWWTGSKFEGVNNEIITHFCKMEFPAPPTDEPGEK